MPIWFGIIFMSTLLICAVMLVSTLLMYAITDYKKQNKKGH